jgi:6-phosphogluconolactonase/glucosamine-6-phosphate isomerase/deaminase
MRHEVFESLDALAGRFTELASDAHAIALSRPTPIAVFSQVVLRDDAVVFQADERVAPLGSPERNATLISEQVAPSTFFPMTSASEYEHVLLDRLGEPPVFDLVHLGLGVDGHTASLLPGDPVLDVNDRWVATSGPAGGFERMTLTFPTLNAARRVVFVVTGEQKAEALQRVLDGDRAMPAARVEATDVTFLADRGAAARL